MHIPDRILLIAPAPDPVSTATAQTVGTPGMGQYFYWIVTWFPIGNTLGGPFPIYNAPDTFDLSNYVEVIGQPSAGALFYDLLRSNTPEFPTDPAAPIAVGGGQASNQPQPVFVDPGGTMGPYQTINGFSRGGAPVNSEIRLNNRDYAQPTMEIAGVLKVQSLLFPGADNNQPVSSGTLAGINTILVPPGYSFNIIAPYNSGQISIMVQNPSATISIRSAGSFQLLAFNGASGLTFNFPQGAAQLYAQSFAINNWGSSASLSGGNFGIGISPGAYRLDVQGEFNVARDSDSAQTFHVDDTGNVIVPQLPTTQPAAGSKMLWADPANGYVVKFAN